VVRRFKKAIIERALGGELTHHLGYALGGTKPEDTTNHRNGTSGKTVLTDDGPLALEVPRDRAGTFEPRLIGKHERRFTGFDDKVIALYARGGGKPEDSTNHRNGTSGKTVLTDDGPLALEVPRDRAGTFEPRLIGKHERRFTGFDDKVIALYARGLTVREIQAFLGEMYGVDVSPDLISTVTDGVVAEVTAWQARPLEPMYPVVFFDALRVKIRDEAVVRSKAVYLALAILPDGTRDVLGIWIEQTEGAKFWMKVFTDLKTRGCQDILIAVTDGLKGMSEALAAIYPATTLQTCIVHLLRNSLDFANWKRAQAPGRRPAADLHGGERGRRAPGARCV
jgi:putative transposase